ncbi:unnamed protein product [Effrenium voratum]|nr:unnamed protein product [Effrenium voratum]
MSLQSSAQLGFAASVFTFASAGLPLSSRNFAKPAPSLPTLGCTRVDSSSSVADVAHPDALLLIQSCARVELAILVLDLLRPGPPLLLQSPTRMGSALPPSGCACTGSSMMALDSVSPGVPLAIRSALKQSGEISLGQDLNVNGYGRFGNWSSVFRVIPILHRQCQRGHLQGLTYWCPLLTQRTSRQACHYIAAHVRTPPWRSWP